jgi:predicted lipid-binding transport protein (Tim44 family)
MNLEIIYKVFAYESRDERHVFVTPTVYEELSQERSDTALTTLLVCLATVIFVQSEKK